MNTASWWGALDSVGFQTMRALLSVLWQSSILLGAVAGLTYVLRRRRASVRQALWAGALLAAPVLPLLAWVGSNLGTPQAEIPVMPTYSVLAERRMSVAPPVEFPEVPPVETAFESPVAVPQVGQEEDFTLTDYPWALALLGYISGLVLFLGLIVVGRSHLGRWVRTGVIVTDPRVLEAFRVAREQVGCSGGCVIVESDRVRAPLTLGTFRPVVLLPRGFARRLSPADLRAVALHEMAHVKRHDPLLLALVSLVRAVFFFHPLVWLACRQVSLLAEQAADDAVLDATGKPIAYAKMLARLAEDLRRRSFTTELAAGILLSKGAFLRRVEAILSDRRHQIRRLSRWALAGTVLAALLSLALAAALPLGEKRLTFEDIAAGIIASRSSLRSLRASYTVEYRDTNWGRVRDEESGRFVSRDSDPGEHEFAVDNISDDSFWHREKLRWYLRCPMPSYGPEAERVTAFDGEYQSLYLPKTRRPWGTISAKADHNWFSWNSDMLDVTYLIYGDTWEHALKTGTLDLKGTEAIDGHPCYVLEGRVSVLPDVGYAGIPVKVWIDPARGFAIVRLEVYSEVNGRLDTFQSYGVLEMKKVAPNLWAPVHVLFRHGKEIVVKDITVNERLPEDLFTIKFPDGTRVQDDRRDRSYTVVDVPTPPQPSHTAEVGKPASELLLEEEASLTLAQFKGKPVVLAFVSIYSKPCVKVLDQLRALQEEKGEENLGVIAVHDRTATPEEIEAFRNDHSIPFPIVRVPDAPRDGWDGDTFRAYGVTALPTVVLIDGEGNVSSALGEGPLEGEVLKLLPESNPSSSTGGPSAEWRSSSALGREDVEALLKAVRRAMRPAENMQVKWRYETVMRTGLSLAPMDNLRPTVRTEYVATIMGDRSRIDSRQQMYRTRESEEPYAIRSIVEVFDSTRQRRLERLLKGSGTPLRGYERLQDTNTSLLAKTLFDCVLPFHDAELLNTYSFSLEPGDVAGTYVLNAALPLPDEQRTKRYRLTIDGNRGFHIIKTECLRPGGGFNNSHKYWGISDGTKYYEIDVTLKRLEDGTWFPSERVRIEYPWVDDKHVQYKVSVTEVTFNVQVPDHTFQLEFPPGTKVSDRAREDWFIVLDEPPKPAVVAEMGKVAPELVLGAITHMERTHRGIIVGWVELVASDVTPELWSSIATSQSYDEFNAHLRPVYPTREANVQVTLRGKSTSATTLTDSSGGFIFGHLPPGVYEVSAQIPTPPAWAGAEPTVTATAQVSVAEDGKSSPVHLALSPPTVASMSNLVSIKGRIMDVNGAPIGGAAVTGKQVFNQSHDIAYEEDYPTKEISTVSDADGSYELNGFDPCDLFRTACYLAGVANEGALERVDVRVQADGYVQNEANAPTVPLVTEVLRGPARSLCNAMLQMPSAAGFPQPLTPSANGEEQRATGVPFPDSKGSTITGIDIVLDAVAEEASAPAAAKTEGPPRILSTAPPAGATDVDPHLSEISVTFDRDMARGFSWTGGGQVYPEVTDRPRWVDNRTCVLPVKLEEGRYYRVGINSKSHRNFKAAYGAPALPTAIYFCTKGSSDQTKQKVQVPEVVRLVPANGAKVVSPETKEIQVTFSVPMGGGFSWTGGGVNYPEGAGKAYWSDDGKTCTRPVRLRPGWNYRLGLNSPSHNNFQSRWGVPLPRVVWTFSTSGQTPRQGETTERSREPDKTAVVGRVTDIDIVLDQAGRD